eukprot:844629-Amphidinium_carterae.1
MNVRILSSCPAGDFSLSCTGLGRGVATSLLSNGRRGAEKERNLTMGPASTLWRVAKRFLLHGNAQSAFRPLHRLDWGIKLVRTPCLPEP